MKITDYEKVTNVVANNVMLLDGDAGTKGILAHDLAVGLQGLLTASEFAAGLKLPSLDIVTATESGQYLLLGSSNGNKAIATEDIVFALIDQIADVNIRRNIFRGKNLGAAYTTAQKAVVKAGTFKGMFCGDYWNISNSNHRIVDFDYWLGQGDTECTEHHFNTMPDKSLYNAKMNDSSITTGGYTGSLMYTTNIANAKTTIASAFGSGFILNHREYLCNAVTNGKPSGGAWVDSTSELPNEPMMYGSYIFMPANDGATIPTRYTINKSQLALMKIHPKWINPHCENQWLRDPVSAAYFALVYYGGYANYYGASGAFGVRCITGVKGA